MKLYLVTNELESQGAGRFEAVYVVAAESEEEALAKAKARGGDGILAQRVRALAFEHDGTVLVWMGLLEGRTTQAKGQTTKSSGMRIER